MAEVKILLILVVNKKDVRPINNMYEQFSQVIGHPHLQLQKEIGARKTLLVSDREWVLLSYIGQYTVLFPMLL